MKIWKEPRVNLLSRQEFIPVEHINWRSDTEVAAEELVEFSGRLCYLSFGEDAGIEGHKTIQGRPGGNEAYINNIIKVKHGSVLEHAVWSILMEGVSRSLTHELVRHRAGFGFSQLSQRYVDESDIGFVLPPELASYEAFAEESLKNPHTAWLDACEGSLVQYRRILNLLEHDLQEDETLTRTMRKKHARQTARSVLPNCAETKIVVTGNARAWRHFIEMRASGGADKEIRALAVATFKLLLTEAPNIFGDYEVVTHTDGTEIVQTKNIKV